MFFVSCFFLIQRKETDGHSGEHEDVVDEESVGGDGDLARPNFPIPKDLVKNLHPSKKKTPQLLTGTIMRAMYDKEFLAGKSVTTLPENEVQDILGNNFLIHHFLWDLYLYP